MTMNMLAPASGQHLTFKPRDYQEDATAAFFRAVAEGYRRPLIVVPTGGGKTVIFNLIIHRFLQAQPTARVIVQAHRQELVEQGEDKFRRFIGPDYITGIVSAKSDRFDYHSQVLFCSKDTIRSSKRMDRILAHGPIALIITDEAHHAEAASYKKVVAALESVNPDLVHLGVTATPQRGDGRGLGLVYDAVPWNKHGACYKKELIEMIPAWLVPPRWLAIKTGIGLAGVKISAGDYNQEQLKNVFESQYCLDLVVKSHIKYADGRKAIAFTISVAGAHELAAKFNEAGIPAAAVDGEMPAQDRARVLRDFAEGRLLVLANCAVLTEGFDDPTVSCIHMARPTKSDSLYLQCIGRGLRPRNGHKPEEKEDCLILEYAPADQRNLSQFGHLMGVPDDDQAKLEKAQRALDEISEDIEIGEVLAGLAYDGQIEMAGVGAQGLDVIAQELNYLDQSPWQWRRDSAQQANAGSWLTLGLGKSRVNGMNMVLAISPLDDLNQYRLYGLWQARDYGPWQVRCLEVFGDFDAASDKAHELADKHGDQTLGAKGKRWRKDPATPQHIGFLRRLGGSAPHGATKGEVNELIAAQVAKNELGRVGVLQQFEQMKESRDAVEQE